MIARVWKGCPAGSAEPYLQHFREHVRPALERLAGHRGSQVLARDGEARAALSSYDDFARHYEVAQ